MAQNAKPQFKVTQMVSSTSASKNFGTLRSRALVEPQFVLDHNTVDIVVMSYTDYEAMYTELQELRALNSFGNE